MKKNYLIVLTLLTTLLLTVPTAFSAQGGTPFNELWEAVNSLTTRVTTLENSAPNEPSLVYYYDSHLSEILSNTWVENAKLYEFTLEPVNPVHTLWQVRVELEHKHVEDENYPHRIMVKVFDENGVQLAYWEQDSANGEYMPLSANLELNPFDSYVSESYRVEIWAKLGVIHLPVWIRNVEISFAVFE